LDPGKGIKLQKYQGICYIDLMKKINPGNLRRGPARPRFSSGIVLRCFFAFLCIISGFSSCAARINGPLYADGSGEFNITASLEPRTAGLIGRLSAFTGTPSANNLMLDGEAIALSMSRAPGIKSVLFSNSAPVAIEGQIQISKIDEFLAAGSRRFISFEQTGAGGRCIIQISRETGPEILSMLSPDISDYLSALMAPIATGESLEKAEYLELVGTVYGKAISDEISNSRIRASIGFPAVVRSVKGGNSTGRQADFNIPLVDLLVLETPLNYEIIWN
jgi:hypothetical protein